MSRGLGENQRAILEVFKEEAGGIKSLRRIGSAVIPPSVLNPVYVAGRVFGKVQVSESEVSSIRRSLRKLTKSGHLVDVGRKGWSDGRKRYGLPRQAEWYNMLISRGYNLEAQCTPDVVVQGTNITATCDLPNLNMEIERNT